MSFLLLRQMLRLKVSGLIECAALSFNHKYCKFDSMLAQPAISFTITQEKFRGVQVIVLQNFQLLKKIEFCL